MILGHKKVPVLPRAENSERYHHITGYLLHPDVRSGVVLEILMSVANAESLPRFGLAKPYD
jgi:hypothetical protein